MDTQETPLVVYRDHWTPEYITLVCGIANAGGGTLVIESNDNIYTTGHRKMRRPFEQIPRIIERDLGIQCTTEPVLDGINLYLEILVPAVAEPLTYEGEYWLYSEGHNTRSTRETVWASLNGTASQQDTEAGDTLSWEMRPQPYVEQGQLNARQFLALGLLKIDAPDPPTSSVATAILRRIDYLNLRDARGEGITNAAIVLLHNHPETIIPGATVQLELVAQDNHALLRNEVGGGISCQVEESLRLLFEQYLPMAVATSTTTENPVIALNFPPQEAVHDVLLDAIVGKNYETGQPVRVSVHPDKLIISMPCGGIETPGGANPVLARALHLMGYLDSQNANFERAVLRCGDMGAPLPVIEHGSRETTVTFSLDSQKTWQMSTPPPCAKFGPQAATGQLLVDAGKRNRRTWRGGAQGRTLLGTIHRRGKQPGFHVDRRVRAARAAHQRPSDGGAHCRRARREREHDTTLVSQAARIRAHRTRGVGQSRLLAREFVRIGLFAMPSGR